MIHDKCDLELTKVNWTIKNYHKMILNLTQYIINIYHLNLSFYVYTYDASVLEEIVLQRKMLLSNINHNYPLINFQKSKKINNVEKY